VLLKDINVKNNEKLPLFLVCRCISVCNECGHKALHRKLYDDSGYFNGRFNTYCNNPKCIYYSCRLYFGTKNYGYSVKSKIIKRKARRTKMEDRTNNKIEKTAKIYYWDEELYLRKIDTTHVSISYEPDGQGVIYHVGQLDHREYYEDLCKWLRDEFDIDNQAYLEEEKNENSNM